MVKTATVEMNGGTYTLHPFNMREMKEVAKLFASGDADMSIRVVEIALRRAEPKIENLDDFEPGVPLNVIAETVLQLSGFKTKTEDPQPAVQPTAN